jgi:hypothetical protein
MTHVGESKDSHIVFTRKGEEQIGLWMSLNIGSNVKTLKSMTDLNNVGEISA